MGKGGSPTEKFYRDRAIVAERRALEVSDPTLKRQWQEIAIEWHALASSAGRESPDSDLI